MHNKLTLSLLFLTLCSVNFAFSQVEKSTLESYIEKKRDYNQNSKVGFSILLYNGNEDEAINLYKSFSEEYKDLDVKLTYVSPNWKVVTHSYATKIEAEQVLLLIKEKYANAKIL